MKRYLCGLIGLALFGASSLIGQTRPSGVNRAVRKLRAAAEAACNAGCNCGDNGCCDCCPRCGCQTGARLPSDVRDEEGNDSQVLLQVQRHLHSGRDPNL